MAVTTSKAAQYLVAGITGTTVVSKAGHYVVEGTEKRVIVGKVGHYIVEGPPVLIPPAPRRRQLNMP